MLFAERLRVSVIHEILRKTFRQWSSKWHYLSLREMNMLMKNFSSLDIETTSFLSLSGRNEPQQNSLTTASGKLFDKLVPLHWYYIVYGIAEK